MLRPELIESLKNFPLVPYLTECHRNGRANVPAALRKQAAELFTRITEQREQLQEEPADISLRRTLFLAQDFLSSEYFLFVHTSPRYDAYMNMPVLERFLTSHLSPNGHTSTQTAWRAISVLLSDWIRTEKTALEKHASQEFDRINFVADKISHRVEILTRAASTLPAGCELPELPALHDACGSNHECDWLYFANHCEGIFALAYLTALPMSQYHDEYMFLRSANVSECCFWAISRAVESAAYALESESPVETVQHLNSAAELASFLTQVFVTFDTLPYENFYEGFRPATGNAGTLQSVNYQQMDFLTRGFNELKHDALRKHCEVASFAKGDADARPTLRWLSKAAEQHPLGSEIADAIGSLRKQLYMWRARHLGIAKRFLPAGVAGTADEGFSFLLKTFRDP